MTQPTTPYEFGDIVLVPFPFTDQSAAKQRPAVIIGSPDYHRELPDVLLMAVTSRAASGFGELPLRHWKQAGLLKPSTVKPVVATIEKTLILRRLGCLSEEDRAALGALLKTLIPH